MAMMINYRGKFRRPTLEDLIPPLRTHRSGGRTSVVGWIRDLKVDVITLVWLWFESRTISRLTQQRRSPGDMLMRKGRGVSLALT